MPTKKRTKRKLILVTPGDIDLEIYEEIEAESRRVLARLKKSKTQETNKPSKRGRKRKGISDKEFQVSAVSLLAKCHQRAVPPPEPLVTLLAKCVDLHVPLADEEDKPVLNQKQWRAIEYIAGLPSFTFFPSEGSLPVDMPVQLIAEKVGVAPKTIYAWWKSDEFHRGLNWYFAMKLVARFKKPKAGRDLKWPASATVCEKCDGKGYLEGGESVLCPICDGNGLIRRKIYPKFQISGNK